MVEEGIHEHQPGKGEVMVDVADVEVEVEEEVGGIAMTRPGHTTTRSGALERK